MSNALQTLVNHFAAGMIAADQRLPHLNPKYQPGLGPHTETDTVRMVMRELEIAEPSSYRDRYSLAVPYPTKPRWKCDLCLGTPEEWDWAVEIKVMRLMGDNGKSNDNMLLHLLSPYPGHRSALTDCDKLLGSGFSGRYAILIYGYDHPIWPLHVAIDAFEVLARARADLGVRCEAPFLNLTHPVHSFGSVFAWQITPNPTPTER